MTKERKQQFLDTFVARVNGHGRAVDKNGNCKYEMDDHPGCAIGCQPEFEPFKGKDLAGPIKTLISTDGFRKFYKDGKLVSMKQMFLLDLEDPDNFNPTDKEGVQFLSLLQELHDNAHSWGLTPETRKYLTKAAITQFCMMFNLKIPNVIYTNKARTKLLKPKGKCQCVPFVGAQPWTQ